MQNLVLYSSRANRSEQVAAATNMCMLRRGYLHYGSVVKSSDTNSTDGALTLRIAHLD